MSGDRGAAPNTRYNDSSNPRAFLMLLKIKNLATLYEKLVVLSWNYLMTPSFPCCLAQVEIFVANQPFCLAISLILSSIFSQTRGTEKKICLSL